MSFLIVGICEHGCNGGTCDDEDMMMTMMMVVVGAGIWWPQLGAVWVSFAAIVSEPYFSSDDKHLKNLKTNLNDTNGMQNRKAVESANFCFSRLPLK